MNPARLVFPAIRWNEAAGFSPALDAAREAARRGVGGFIIFGGTADAVRDLTTGLEEYAGRPLLFAADLERGAGQQFQGLPELPPPLALASLWTGGSFYAGLSTAMHAASVGVHWVLGPVADLDVEPENPIVQTRSFGSEPAEVSQHVKAWVEGCQAMALACAKHYPGHGRTTADSHSVLPVVEQPATTLEADLAPFDAARAAGVATIMTAHVSYPAWDPTGAPATFSKPILGGLRRRGFDGLIVSDALIMEGARAGATDAGAALGALRAGVDILLYPPDPLAVIDAVESAVKAEHSVREATGRSLERLSAAVTMSRRDRGVSIESMDLGATLLRQGLMRGKRASLRSPIDLVIVDDDLDGDYPPSSSDFVRQALARGGAWLGAGGSQVVLAFAEPRAGKRRGGFGQRALSELAVHAPGASLVVLFGHPRLEASIPGDAPVLLAWHRQRLMQEAVAHWMRTHQA